MSAPDRRWQLDGRLLDLLDTLGTHVERVETGAYVVHLVGARRPSTLVWLVAGERELAVEAFVLHLLEGADCAAVSRALLRRNLALRRVHFALDDVGDVFLVGSLPLTAVSADLLDGVLGEVLDLLDDAHPLLLQLAYGDRLDNDEALAAKVRSDGAGRRPAGTPSWAPRRDVRR